MRLALHSVSYAGVWPGQVRLALEPILDKAVKFGYEGVMLVAVEVHEHTFMEDLVVVDGFQAKSGQPRGNARTVTLATTGQRLGAEASEYQRELAATAGALEMGEDLRDAAPDDLLKLLGELARRRHRALRSHRRCRVLERRDHAVGRLKTDERLRIGRAGERRRLLRGHWQSRGG